jgi:hypothetical protein
MEYPFDFEAFAEAIGLQRSDDSGALRYWSAGVVITHEGDLLCLTEWGYSPELALDTVVDRGGEVLVCPAGRSPSCAVSQKMPWPQTFADTFATFVACGWCDLQAREEIETMYLLWLGRRLGFDLPRPARPSPMVKKGVREGRVFR